MGLDRTETSIYNIALIGSYFGIGKEESRFLMLLILLFGGFLILEIIRFLVAFLL